MKSSELAVVKIRNYIEFFDCFEHVYLFGSVLNSSMIYNDIDILIIYREYSSELVKQLKVIVHQLEQEFETFIDLTVLSVEEEREISFLKKLKSDYLQLK